MTSFPLSSSSSVIVASGILWMCILSIVGVVLETNAFIHNHNPTITRLQTSTVTIPFQNNNFSSDNKFLPTRLQQTTTGSDEDMETATTTTVAKASSTTTLTREEQLVQQKQKILGLVRPSSSSSSSSSPSSSKRKYIDPVLADPITKQSLEITLSSTSSIGGDVEFQLKPINDQDDGTAVATTTETYYKGSVGTYLDLLNPVVVESTKKENENSSNKNNNNNERLAWLMRQAIPYTPPPLRGVIGNVIGGDNDDEYVPMRDLFTSPAVSFAYERGWRQGFQRAGFPGPDVEAKLATDYFAPAIASASASASSSPTVLVDMSCATGLFTRRFASMKDELGIDRVIGCDYSDSMLTEARRRINADPTLSNRQRGLDLVRLDVGQIPMKDNSVDVLHAGAAMHCWPDLDRAASEIYRVLRPGGRYFASTFLSTYFSALSGIDGQSNTPPSQQAFQYFESIDTLSSLLERGGFSREKILIEVLGTACVIIRAEK